MKLIPFKSYLFPIKKNSSEYWAKKLTRPE